MKQGREQIGIMVALFAIVLITIGISFAAFQYIGQGQKTNTVQSGNLTFVYDESNKEGNGISISNATPTSDEEGKSSLKSGEVFEFSVTASTKGSPIYYEIYVTKQENSTLPERIIKTYLTELQGTEEVEVLDPLNHQSVNFYHKLGLSQVPNGENGRTLYQEMISEGQDNYSKTFRYRMWIDGKRAELNERGIWKYSDKSFTVKVNVYASNEDIGAPIKPEVEANEPVLVEGQIPVIYDSTKSSWVKADTGTTWYDYKNQNWANAVTVKESGTKTRSEYLLAEPGTPISMDDINTMWVWIPRYEYMYTNLGTQYAGGTKEEPGEIRVNFLEGKNITVSDAASYKVHPAFIFGEDELEGLWYAKFEVGGNLSTACANESCNVSNVVVKPSVTSLREQNVSSFFYLARSMQMNSSSPFGFSKTDANLHMSKNSEWGSVAYLSQSKYGKYGNSNYIGIEKEIYQNKSSTNITGSSNKTPSTEEVNEQVSYDIEKSGTGASTTGNITGIYDMSGGANEYVMGVLADPNGNPRSGYQLNNNSHSGFTGMLENGSSYSGLAFPNLKYYDLYTTTDANSNVGSLSEKGCNGGICFGHALSETGEWYHDCYQYPFSTYPWIIRGGHFSSRTEAGIFLSYYDYGDEKNHISTRLVIAPGV